MDKVDKSLQWSGNPRKISDKQLKLLKEHIEELGDLGGVVYCRNQKAYVGGNQRSKIFDGAEVTILKEYKNPTATGTVAEGYITHKGERYAYREVAFTEEQFRKACVVANNDGGEWDFSTLSSWNKEELNEWGFKSLSAFGDPVVNKYISKIARPVYEPKREERPNIAECVNTEKYEAMIREINKAKVSEEEKRLLIMCAARHIEFNYQNIAEFYCHSSAVVQALMERSALVIIDFKSAIEQGYVRLSEEIAELYKEQEGE